MMDASATRDPLALHFTFAKRQPFVVVAGFIDSTEFALVRIKVLTLSQVAWASLESTIFGVLEGLKLSYEKAILVAWDDDVEFEDEVTKEIVVDWLERFADLAGVKVVSTSSPKVLARIIRDFHDHVKGSAVASRVKGSAGMCAWVGGSTRFSRSWNRN